jgi:hypothetical protein
MSKHQYNYKNDDNTRWHFYESWISEMPQKLPPRYDFDLLLSELKDFLSRNEEQVVYNNIFYAQSENFLYVYGKVNDTISIISYLEKHRQSAFVLNTQKNNLFLKIPPSSVDIYIAALEVTKPLSLVFTSDNKMTENGLSIWKRLLKLGKHISVYDTTIKSRVGKTLIPISNEKDLEKYFGDNLQHGNFRYVLSENIQNYNNQVNDRFMMRRICESSGTIDDDIYEEEDK